MRAYCGLDCGSCGAYVATVKGDDAARREVAELWRKEFGADVKPEDINCGGCTSEGPLYSYCNSCEIRACAREKSVGSCAVCAEYGCERIESFLKQAPQCREYLTAERNRAGL